MKTKFLKFITYAVVFSILNTNTYWAESFRQDQPHSSLSPRSVGEEGNKGIKVNKEVLIRKLEEINWNLPEFRNFVASSLGIKARSIANLLQRLDLTEEFKEKYHEVRRLKMGFMERIARYFGVSKYVMDTIKKELGISDAEEEIAVTKGSILSVIGMEKRAVLRLIRGKKIGWNFKRLIERLGISSAFSIYYLIIGLDIKDEFSKKWREIYRLKQGWYEALEDYFGLSKKLLKEVVWRLGIDTSDIKLFTRGSILRGYKLDKDDILRELKKLKWDIPLFRKRLNEEKIVPILIRFHDLLMGLDIVNEFLERFDEVYRRNQNNFKRTADDFHLRDTDLRELLRKFGREGLDSALFAMFTEGGLLKISGLSHEGLMELVRKNKWRLDRLIRYFRKKGWLRKRVSYIDFIKGLGITKEFGEEVTRVYREKKEDRELTSRYFGLFDYTLFNIVKELGINLDVIETKEEREFKSIIHIYAKMLAENKKNEDILKILEPLIKEFTGWEVEPEDGEISTKFFKSNWLIIRGLKPKRYKMVFEWHRTLGLVLALKEEGKESGEDLICDIRNCRKYNNKGHYKQIYVRRRWKRNDLKRIDFNWIIERYATHLRAKRALADIIGDLRESIQRFGSWEYKIRGRTFITTPVSGRKILKFNSLPKGKVFIRFQWDDLLGLLVTFGRNKGDSKEDLVYDVSPYVHSESQTPVCAIKIGVRDELNRERLNRVILKYANLLRDGMSLERIKGEMRKEMGLSKGWRKEIKGGVFSLTPVKKNTLQFHRLPEGAYNITLEWQEPIGMVVVFSKEDGDRDYIYSINNYIAPNERRERQKKYTALKCGERTRSVKAMEEPEYQTLEKESKIKDPDGNIYILLGRCDRGTEEVLLAPDNTLALRQVSDNKIKKIKVQKAADDGWLVLVNEDKPEDPDSWVRISKLTGHPDGTDNPATEEPVSTVGEGYGDTEGVLSSV